jgi:hypothetical protein
LNRMPSKTWRFWLFGGARIRALFKLTEYGQVTI